MRKIICLIIIAALACSVHARINVQQMLSEQTFAHGGEDVWVTHLLTNHRNTSITDIQLFERYPEEAGPELVYCHNCELLRQEHGTLFIRCPDIPPMSTMNVTYQVKLDSGNHTLNLGHKKYTYMGAVQERLGKDYPVGVQGRGSRRLLYVLGGVLVAAISWRLVRKKVRFV